MELVENYSASGKFILPEEEQTQVQAILSPKQPTKKKIFEVTFFIIVIVTCDIIYFSLERQCRLDMEGDCFLEIIFQNIVSLLTTMLILTFTNATLICITAISNRYKKYLKFVLINFTFILFSVNEKPSLYNYAYFYTFFLVLLTTIWLVVLFSIMGLILLTRKMYRVRKCYLWYTPLSLIGIVILLISIYNKLLQTHDSWENNWFEQHKQFISPSGNRYPNFQVPERDWYNLLSGVQDPTTFLYDCTSEPFTNVDVKRKVLHKFIPQSINNRYLASPRLLDQDIPYVFDRYSYSQFVLAHTTGYNDLNLIPAETEYILDTKTLTYTIDVKRNETLVNERYILRKKLEDQMKEAKIQRKLPKNIIVLYIDAISRKRLASKLPQLQKWLQSFEEKFNQSHQFFKGVRSTNLDTFTYPNLMAYFFGAMYKRTNYRLTSDYSMTGGPTNIENQTFYDNNNGQTHVQEVYKSKVKHHSVIDDFRKAGYITGISYTDCNTNPMTLDGHGQILDEIFDNINYDHMGFLNSCDPNFFNPNNFEGIGQGPNSIFRRCLYGKEQIDYSIEYVQSFMTKYKDQPKFLQMGFIEAHEGTQEGITHIDNKFVQLMQWLEDENAFEDSAFLFLSDHGMHLNNLMNYLESEVSLLEKRLPIQLLYIDKTLLNATDLLKQFDFCLRNFSLEENQQRLTTMFEVHYFYKYLLNVENSSFYRDNSLVSDKIPVNRQLKDLSRFKPLNITTYPDLGEI